MMDVLSRIARTTLNPGACCLLGILLICTSLLAPALAAGPDQGNPFDEDGVMIMGLDIQRNDDRPGQGNKPDDDDEYEVSFTENFNLSSNPDRPNNEFPNAKILANGDLAVMWSASSSIYVDAKYLMFARSSDNGETWSITMAHDVSDVELYSGDSFRMEKPDFCELEDGGLAVVWHGLYWTGATYLGSYHFSRSDDGGATWSDPVDLPGIEPLNGERSGYNPAIVEAEGKIIVAWGTMRDWPVGRLFCVTSTDGGSRWSNPIEITPYLVNTCEDQTYLTYNPVYGQVSVIARSGINVVFIHSDDLGMTWDSGVSVNGDFGSDPDWPAMAMGPEGNYYVVWSDDGRRDQEVFFSKSTDGGVNWSSPSIVNDALPSGNNYEAHVAADPSGGVHVAWLWNIPFDTELNIYYTYSDNGGNSWLAPNPQVNDHPDAVAVDICYTMEILAKDDGTAYLWWKDSRDEGYNIFFSHSVVEEDDSRLLASSLVPSFDLQAVPNPFNPMTKIHFRLPQASATDVRIFNARGQVVRTLLAGQTLAAGAQEVLWNGKDDAGCDVSAGVYFYQVQAGDLVQTDRMTLVR